ncbi:MAG TPA: glycogen debranching N-terminal domain-containing protein [Galbitalea sp.]|jgi:glycogen debranching enzyme|nr:glycogen debranching N-terminal domain-containing protein [Galbitalea sp.]
MTDELEQLRQPLLSESTIVLRAPTQAWSSTTGAIGESPIDGVYFSDTRIVRLLDVRFDGRHAETIATVPRGSDAVDFVCVLRHLDDGTPDPRVRAVHTRHATATGIDEEITVSSGLSSPIETEVVIRLAADLAGMDAVKSGIGAETVEIEIVDGGARWGNGSVIAELRTDARLSHVGREVELSWHIVVRSGSDASVRWSIVAEDKGAVVAAASRPADWVVPASSRHDDRLDRWVAQALVDLDTLRMTTVADPASIFLAAGAPWFFTLFGRDSIWAARFLAPLGGTLAADTLRVLAGMQGNVDNPATSEQPGKIMHELRRGVLNLPSHGISIPPLYYGTVDATPLWICLLHDAQAWGMPDSEIEALLPNLTAALEWMRDFGDADGDGLLEYIDTTGQGLTNQGWKDSGDSVQWRSGALATAPIALCEVQAYAYEAATLGADLLERFGRPTTGWRTWAERLKARFNESYWIDDPAGAYPAIALDADKRPVDSLTSNIGHLLGTGLLDAKQSELVANRLVSPELNSGFGLRTMSTNSAGYWPLSYHGGSVWPHDTAIAIRGLTAAGLPDAAAELAEGLLAAAASFNYRMPELHSGDAATRFARAVPYPAACRPQAWSAAAAIAVYSSKMGLTPPR